MKLFLASSLDKSISLLNEKIEGSLKNKRVLFIANASDLATEDPWWVHSDRKVFERMNAKPVDVDLRKISIEDFKKELKQSDIVHFCGGSVLYLINIVREGGFEQALKDAVTKDEIVFTGTSAGSMIVANDLSLTRFDPEEEFVKNKIKDFSGLKFVNFLIMPHSNNEGFAEGSKTVIENLHKYNEPLLFLYDNQAVWVEDKRIEILFV
jgi:peptidase E